MARWLNSYRCETIKLPVWCAKRRWMKPTAIVSIYLLMVLKRILRVCFLISCVSLMSRFWRTSLAQRGRTVNRSQLIVIMCASILIWGKQATSPSPSSSINITSHSPSRERVHKHFNCFDTPSDVSQWTALATLIHNQLRLIKRMTHLEQVTGF